MSDDTIDLAVEAIRAGKPAILPTDTVYGLCATPYASAPVERLYRLKGRELGQPTALLAADLDLLFECVPELRGRAGTIARALLPGPYTLVLANPARRFRWLCGPNPAAIGVRVPELPAAGAAVLARVGAVAATSANAPGGPDPCRLDEVPDEIRSGAAAAGRRRRAAGDALDRARLLRPGAARSPRGRRARRRGDRACRRGAGVASAAPPKRRRERRVRRAGDLSAAHDRRARGRRPRHRRPARTRARPPARPDRADRLRELHVAVRARGGRLRADEQVRRGLPGQALLRRLRGRRRDRAARDRPREGALRRRARERPAARRLADEHGRLRGRARPGRHDPLAAPRPRRPPDPRAQGQLQRPALHDLGLRRLARDDDGRLRRGARAGEGGAAEADRLRRLRVPAHRRDRPLPRHRRRGRRPAPLRHGALRRPRRGRAAPEPGRALRLRHLDDAQDARRAARRVHPLPRRARPGGRPRRLPRHAGRPARAHDRREGDVLQDRDDRRVPQLPGADPPQRRRSRVDAPGGRARARHRRHRHPPDAARPAQLRVDGQGGRGAAPRGADHRQPQHRPVRRAPADGRLRDPDRHAGDDDARLRRGRLRGRSAGSSSTRSPTRPTSTRCAARVEALCAKRPLYPGFRGWTRYA